MQYLEVNIKTNDKEKMEMLSAFLSEIGYDSFVEENFNFKAYIEKEKFNKKNLKNILSKQFLKIDYELKTVKNENWNEKWEKSFKPVQIEDKCIIKAPFHKIDKKFDYEIIIHPKMSFGTGHHESTFLMMKSMLQYNFKNKKVFDIGCGTGILSILASLLGANTILSIDIDEWSVINIKENMQLNNVNNISSCNATIKDINQENADIILANINRNVLLEEIPYYAGLLNKNALLILSGFYAEDFASINKVTQKNNLRLEKKLEKNNWLALTYKKVR